MPDSEVGGQIHSGDVSQPLGRLLLVEDNLADAFIIEQVFALAGIPVALQFARDGEEALFILRQENRRAALSGVLLDLSLPKVSGFEVLAEACQEGWNLLIIVVTCTDWPANLARIVELGASAYFRKPFTLIEYLELPKVFLSLLERERNKALEDGKAGLGAAG